MVMQDMEMGLLIAQVARYWLVTDELARENIILRASSVFPPSLKIFSIRIYDHPQWFAKALIK
jgi:hypothetical protein